MKNGDVIPSSVEAEKGLLGSILLAPDRIMTEQAWLRPSHFYHPSHAEIFEEISAMREARKPVDFISLTQWLEDRGELEKVGGAVYVTELFTYVPTASNASYYAELVKQKSIARSVIDFGRQLIADAIDPDKQEDLLARVKSALADISELPRSQGSRELPPMVSLRDLCENPPPTPPQIIEGILHQGSKMALGGGSKSFKTWTLFEMAICIAAGREWLGFPTTKGRVLYVNFELPAFAMEKRGREICQAMRIEVPENITVWNLRGYASDAAVILPMISREAKAGGFVLIILDPLYKLLGNREENTSRDMANLMNEVERLAVETDAAVGFGSHFAKGNASQKESMDRISGSGVFARDPDSIVTMTQHEEPGAFAVEMTLRNFPPQEPFVVRRHHPLMVIDGKLDPAKLKKPVGGRTSIYDAKDVLKCLDGSMTDTAWKQACAECGISKTTYYRLKGDILKEGKVFQSAIDQTWSLKP